MAEFFLQAVVVLAQQIQCMRKTLLRLLGDAQGAKKPLLRALRSVL